jgi:two-component system, NtrC family, response regulator HupR/HoxA
MINWKDIGELHVITKLDEFLAKWFGTELIFVDSHNNIKSKHSVTDSEFQNPLFNIQMKMNSGHESLEQDLENISEELQNGKNSNIVFDSCIKKVKGIASRVEVDGEYLGMVIAYPFLPEKLTNTGKKEIIKQFTKGGASEEDVAVAIDDLKLLSNVDVEYLNELTDLVTEEIVTFHNEISSRENRIQELNSELGDKYRYHSMIGKSKKMQEVYRLLEKISSSESSVFVQGENGTGKELVAKAIHYYSPRKENLFLAVNCSAFNDNLLDSELFGHVKGAFTGAIKDKKGLFEQANGGTLFLDEIGDTSLSMQVKLLRVLQEGTYMPVGATTPQKSNVRIIAATNKNITEMMSTGEFREDLYYRINVINVKLPCLKERKEDIQILLDHFLKKRCDEEGRPLKSISKQCLERLYDYNWPGNVRELENEVERLVVLAGEDKTIGPEFLSPRITDSTDGGKKFGKGINTDGNLKIALEELETYMIGEGLERCGFNKSRLSKELGISRASLIMKVEKYGLDKRKKAAGE